MNLFKSKRPCMWHIARGGKPCAKAAVQGIDYCSSQVKKLELAFERQSKDLERLRLEYGELNFRSKPESFSSKLVMTVLSGASGSLVTALVENWDAFVSLIRFTWMSPPAIKIDIPGTGHVFLGRVDYEDNKLIGMGCEDLPRERTDKVIAIMIASIRKTTLPRQS